MLLVIGLTSKSWSKFLYVSNQRGPEEGRGRRDTCYNLERPDYIIVIKTLTHMWGVYCLWLVSVLSHSLRGNNIGDEGMIAMSKAACHWTNLQKLE